MSVFDSALSVPHSKKTTVFTIAELAGMFDVTARTIRFYEDEGLIAPTRRGQTRLYSKRDMARLAWVLRGKRVGFSLAEIREMLDLYGADATRMKQRVKTIEKCQQRIVTLESQRNDIDHIITELREFCDTISSLVALDVGRKTVSISNCQVDHK